MGPGAEGPGPDLGRPGRQAESSAGSTGGPDTPGSGPRPLLDIRGLTVRFAGPDGHAGSAGSGDAVVVDHLDLHVERGEIVALIGASGSGKSLTASSVLGIEPASANVTGEILLDGEDLRRLDPRGWRRVRGHRVAMIFQSPAAALDPTRRIGAQLAVLGLRGDDATEALRETGLADASRIADRHPHQLSGGEQQRVMIAMALARGPELLIADEPTTALDADLRRHVLELLARLAERRSMALLVISHDLHSVRELADRVVVVDGGRVVETGPTGVLLTAPRHDVTRALLDAGRLVGSVDGGVARGAAAAAEPPPPSSHPLLQVSDLSVRFPSPLRLRRRPSVTAVEGLDLALERGRITALVGPSGSGKSTVARAIVGLGPDWEGSIRLDGDDLRSLRRQRPRLVRRRIQLVSQDARASLDPRQTLGAALDEPGRRLAHRTDPQELGERRRSLLDEVGLAPVLADRRPSELSGGECQRGAIARALACDPDLLVCDEITSSLDTLAQARIVELLRGLVARRSLSLLFISHDLDLVRSLADEVVRLHAPHPGN